MTLPQSIEEMVKEELNRLYKRLLHDAKERLLNCKNDSRDFHVCEYTDSDGAITIEAIERTFKSLLEE